VAHEARFVITRAGAAVALALALVSAASAAGAPSRDADFTLSEVRSPSRTDAKYVPLFDPTAAWPATFQWKYNAAGAPAAFDKATVVTTLQRAFDKWSAQCNVRHVYAGETTAVPHATDGVAGPDYQSVIGWKALSSNAAYTYAWWSGADASRQLVDADTELSPSLVTSLEGLDRVATHEFGHAIGLAHSNVDAAVMAGPPLVSYNLLATPQADDIRGCRCLYGMPAGQSAPYVCQLPSSVDFATLPVNASSPPKSVAFHNSGNAPLSIDNVAIGDATFKTLGGCTAGTIVRPGETCTLQLAAAPTRGGPIASSIKLFTNDGTYELPLTVLGQGTTTPPATPPATPPSAPLPAPAPALPTVDVVEFYNASLDHYFITWIASEIANLDAGVTPTRWVRTGYSFKAYATPQSGTSQICRFYIPPVDGSSHFFGRNPAECDATKREHPEFVLEDASYMQLYVPVAGACPAGSVAIYRLFNNRPDANHRYITDSFARDQMAARGWIAEGDGPDRVVMCAPQ